LLQSRREKEKEKASRKSKAASRIGGQLSRDERWCALN